VIINTWISQNYTLSFYRSQFSIIIITKIASVSESRRSSAVKIHWNTRYRLYINTQCLRKKLCKIVSVRTLSNFHQL